MSYHLGLGSQATPTSLTYGYFRVSDPAVRDQLVRAGIPLDALPEDRDLRRVSGPWFQAFFTKQSGEVDFDLVNKDTRTRSGISNMGESYIARLKAALPLIPSGVTRLSLQQVNSEIEASRSAATVTPDSSRPATKSTSSKAQEDESFLTRKVGGVPVWAIGAGVLTLGVGLVLVAKKPASVAKNPRDRLSLRDRSRKRRRGELEWPPWGTSEEVEAVEMIASPPGIATRVKTTWGRGDEKQVLYRLSPPYEYNRLGDTTEYALSSAQIIGGRKETVVFASDASGQRFFDLPEGGGLHTLDTDQSIRDLGYTVVPAKSSSLTANRRRGLPRSV